MNFSFSFVILHYKTINDTIKCVDSILDKIDVEEYKIIIVDNYSNDGTGEKLKSLYENCKKIEVIINKKNLGFAGGNNIGYMYAKKNFNSDFIVLLNNDTYIIQEDFCEVIKNEYKQSKFAVMGPVIYTSNSNSGKCNPMRENYIDNGEINRFIMKYKMYIYLSCINMDIFYIKSKNFVKRYINNIKKDHIDYSIRMENVQLHGCCLIFSKEYISRYDGLDNRTFLYMEEDILFIEMSRRKLLTVYNPNLKIFHNEEVTSKYISSTRKKQRVNKYKNILKSAYIVRDILNNELD